MQTCKDNVLKIILKYSRSYTTLPGSHNMPGLVPEGAKCGTNKVTLCITWKGFINYCTYVELAFLLNRCVKIINA